MITGAASGIGKACRGLAISRGWQPIAADLREGDITADLSKPEGRERLVHEATRLTGGKLDAVIACAAGAIAQPALALPVNFFGAVATLEGLRPLLAKAEQPRAVAVSSWAASQPYDESLVNACLAGDEAKALRIAAGNTDFGPLYGASKAALSRWIRRAAITKPWAGAGILLNAIAPGYVRTPMVASITDNPAARADLEKMMPMPIGRDALPAEMAEILLWLASSANSMIVGQTIYVDGGAEATVRGDARI